MGFFQDLKEDLSMAVSELIPEVDEELENPGETGEKERDTAAEEVAVPEEKKEETVVVNEDIFRAAVDRLDENADLFAEKLLQDAEVKEERDAAEVSIEETMAEAPSAEEMTVEESAAEEIGQREEKPEEAAPDNSGQEADSVAATEEMAMADALVKEVCEEIEHADEETELEKEVGKIMTKQNETVMTGEVLDETAVITQGMKVNGDVSSQGSMEVLGTIKGNIDILGKLNISGEVEGNSNAAEVFADSAKITGDIHATSSVKVGQSSVIIGNIYATSAVIAGAVKGDIDVQGPVILDTSAIVMGNIKSKSVQINNGAVIEGMCSQCYADVNPASFFQDLNK